MQERAAPHKPDMSGLPVACSSCTTIRPARCKPAVKDGDIKLHAQVLAAVCAFLVEYASQLILAYCGFALNPDERIAATRDPRHHGQNGHGHHDKSIAGGERNPRKLARLRDFQDHGRI